MCGFGTPLGRLLKLLWFPHRAYCASSVPSASSPRTWARGVMPAMGTNLRSCRVTFVVCYFESSLTGCLRVSPWLASNSEIPYTWPNNSFIIITVLIIILGVLYVLLAFVLIYYIYLLLCIHESLAHRWGSDRNWQESVLPWCKF